MRELSGKSALAVLAVALNAAASIWAGSASGAGPTHGLSIHGDLKYGPGFTHFTIMHSLGSLPGSAGDVG